MTFGERLKFARELKGYSQSRLSSLTNIQQATISRYESDSKVVNGDDLRSIAVVLEVPTDYLLGLQEEFINIDSHLYRAIKTREELIKNSKDAVLYSFLGGYADICELIDKELEHIKPSSKNKQ